MGAGSRIIIDSSTQPTTTKPGKILTFQEKIKFEISFVRLSPLLKDFILETNTFIGSKIFFVWIGLKLIALAFTSLQSTLSVYSPTDNQLNRYMFRKCLPWQGFKVKSTKMIIAFLAEPFLAS